MSGTPDIHGLARQQAVLEERMNTMQAEYETALERFGRQTDTALERMERRISERDRGNMRWQVGITIGAVAVGVAILGAFIALDDAPSPAPVVIQTAPPAAQSPAEARTAPEGLPDAGAAEPQPDS